jgi:hypothetical protein
MFFSIRKFFRLDKKPTTDVGGRSADNHNVSNTNDGNSSVSSKEKLKNDYRKEDNRKNNKSRLWGLFFILIGSLIILLTLLLEYPVNNFKQLGVLFLKFFEHVGIAAIILGLVTIIVDFDTWRKYFQERLADTIVRRDFLETLSPEKLVDLQTDTMTAYYKTEDVSREDSFLKFFRAKIQDFIGSPYREDVDNLIIIKDGDDVLYVEDIISYKCKKVGKCIQSDIGWENEESIEISSFNIKIKIPETNDPMIVIEKDGDSLLEKSKTEKTFKFPLTEYKEIDDLWIEVYAKYTVKKSELFYFQMTHPTHKLKVMVDYPENLGLSEAFFGIKEDELKKRSVAGIFSVNYDSWLLPNAGFAFLLTDKKTGTEHPAQPPVTGPKVVLPEAKINESNADSSKKNASSDTSAINTSNINTPEVQLTSIVGTTPTVPGSPAVDTVSINPESNPASEKSDRGSGE